MALETSKTLGGVGAILMFVGIFPVISSYAVLEIIGVILVFVALYNLAGYYRERGIFNNALFGLIAGIVGVFAAAVTAVFTFLTSLTDFLHEVYPTWNGDFASLSGLTPEPANITMENLFPLLAGLLAVLVILWIFAIVAAFFVRRSLVTLSVKTGVGLFSTSGMLLLIGAVLIIAFGIGLILVWIAALLLAIAFFTMKPQEAQAASGSASASAST
jgi:uncharacterized membrane protein